jgi:hypothetical protein
MDATDDGSVYPVIWLAAHNGKDITNLNVRQTWAVAARRLAEWGLVTTRYVNVPTARGGIFGDYMDPRDVLCVHDTNAEITDKQLALARERALEMFFPTNK